MPRSARAVPRDDVAQSGASLRRGPNGPPPREGPSFDKCHSPSLTAGVAEIRHRTAPSEPGTIRQVSKGATTRGKEPGRRDRLEGQTSTRTVEKRPESDTGNIVHKGSGVPPEEPESRATEKEEREYEEEETGRDGVRPPPSGPPRLRLPPVRPSPPRFVRRAPVLLLAGLVLVP
ncbi:hypothetical protein THAOC_07094, partial [Thalassiosira oceanica]